MYTHINIVTNTCQYDDISHSTSLCDTHLTNVIICIYKETHFERQYFHNITVITLQFYRPVFVEAQVSLFLWGLSNKLVYLRTICYISSILFFLMLFAKKGRKKVRNKVEFYYLFTDLLTYWLTYLLTYLLTPWSLYIFRATSCLSSGGQIVLIQHLLSSLWKQVSGLKLLKYNLLQTRCCINKIWPPDDEHDVARNM